jgi:hypothetical protein
MNPFSEHPAPWTYEFDEDENLFFVIDADGNDIASVCSQEIAHRIVHSVNKNGQ